MKPGPIDSDAVPRDSYTRYPRPILWLVRGGTVTIGGGEGDARPRFEAEVEPFYIGKFPVTNEQFEAFHPGFERAPVSAGDRDPAAGVSFDAAASYCEWYASVSRKPMRLPTEVEWEYACRAGARARTCFGDEPADDFLWHAGNSDGRVGRLDAKNANDFGLYGMLGGVWEWTGERVLRGGSVCLDGAEITCSVRRAEDPETGPGDAGFRIVKSFR